MHQGPKPPSYTSQQQPQVAVNPTMVPYHTPRIPPFYLPYFNPLLSVSGMPSLQAHAMCRHAFRASMAQESALPSTGPSPQPPTKTYPKDILDTLRQEIEFAEASIDLQLIFIRNPASIPTHMDFSLQDYLKTHEKTKAKKIALEDAYFDTLIERIMALSKNTLALHSTAHGYSYQQHASAYKQEAFYLRQHLQRYLFLRLLEATPHRSEPAEQALEAFKKSLMSLCLFELLDDLPKIKTSAVLEKNNFHELTLKMEKLNIEPAILKPHTASRLPKKTPLGTS